MAGGCWQSSGCATPWSRQRQLYTSRASGATGVSSWRCRSCSSPWMGVGLSGLLLSACLTEPSIAPPIVASFAAVPATILRGDSAKLIWTVYEADSLVLSPGIGVVSGTRIWLQPMSTTEYTLVAVNRAGRDSAHATVTLTLPPLPVITSFVASADTIVG